MVSLYFVIEVTDEVNAVIIHELAQKSVKKLFANKILNPWCSSMMGTKYTVCVITPCCYGTILKCTHNMYVAFKTGFILLTFTRTPLTLIFHLSHMSILYRCNRKKIKIPSSVFETSLLENNAPVSDELQQCTKVHTGRSSVRITETVTTRAEQNEKLSFEIWFMKYYYTFYTHN